MVYLPTSSKMDARKERKKSYSDLEAIITSPIASRQSYWDAKFAVPNTPDPTLARSTTRASQAPEAVPQIPHFNTWRDEKPAHDVRPGFSHTSSPIDMVGPPAYYIVDAKGQTQALYTVPTNSPSDTASMASFKERGISPVNFRGGGASPVSPPGARDSGGWWSALGEGRRICGMRKNIFLAVMAGACALTLGLLITILLVTMHHRGGNGGKNEAVQNATEAAAPAAQTPFSTETLLTKGDAGPFLAASNVAAMNWTVGSQVFTGIFYQSSAATGASLMAAIRTEDTQTWTTVNISASVTGKLDIMLGSPLAAASNNGLWNVYYLTRSMMLAEMYSTDPTNAKGWLIGSFAAKMGAPEVSPHSGLGAMWQACDQCGDSLWVSWQNAQDGALMHASMDNLTWSSPAPLDVNVTAGTQVTINAFTDEGRSWGADHNAIRFYYNKGDTVQEMLKGPLGGSKLVMGNNSKRLSRTYK